MITTPCICFPCAGGLGAGARSVVGYCFFGGYDARGGVCRYPRQDFTVS
ncbi:MAG: hypothetical protein ACYTF8_18420 [Planctomycetota bacterium]